MKLKLKRLHFDAGRPITFLNEEFARNFDIHVGDRIEISFRGKKAISIVDTTTFVRKNEVSLSDESITFLGTRPGEFIEVSQLSEPASAPLISKKMNGKPLTKEEVYSIVKDIANNALTEAEIAFFVSIVSEKGMSFKETLYLTEAMYKTGQVLKWPSSYKVADKHSIGGIPANRTTPIVVSICAAAGVVMPKTSSRAITSAAGTADTIETLTRVNLTLPELRKVVSKTGACLAWGGSLGLAPADDKLIRVERLLNLDPESQLLASIISKKLAAGSEYVLIDIPCGTGAKVTFAEAKKLKLKFLSIAKHFKLKMRVIITEGGEPIGNGIGPVLEMIDVIKVLRQEDSPRDLEEKSLMLAGEILELVGKSKKGEGKVLALEMLQSKKALKKFEEIVSAQGKNKSPLVLAKFSSELRSSKAGKIKQIDNRIINHLARILGCPLDKGAGIYLYKHRGDFVSKGETLLKIYCESAKKLDEAKKSFNLQNPFTLG